MRILRTAAIVFAASLSLAAPPAWSQRGGHFGGHDGGGHGQFSGGGAHFNGMGRHGAIHGGAHRGAFGHRFHGDRFGPAFIVGGIWYPWYSYPYPVYSGTAYYCQSAGLYYPDVTYCPEGWVTVAPPAMLP